MSAKFIVAVCTVTTLFAIEPYYLRSSFIHYQRILDTIGCHDCDYIPKVLGAGQIFRENGVSYQLMHNGLKVVKNGYEGEWMSYIIKKLAGHHEPQEEKVFFETLKTIPNNSIMIELGSFWAYYSMWFQKSIPGAVNYLIEAGAKQLAIGKKNFALNGMKGTFIRGFINYEDAPSNIKHFGQDAHAVTVDELVSAYQMPFVWVVHSDIQGYEYRMLLGCQQTLAQKKIGYFFISTHSEEVHAKCKNFLLNQSFTMVAEHTPAESVSGDGLLAARAPYVGGLTTVTISKKELPGAKNARVNA